MRRDRGPRDLRQRLPVVERRAEDVSRLDEEPLRVARPALVVDVRRGADVAGDLPGRVAHGNGAAEVPAVAAVAPPQPVLHLEDAAAGRRPLEPDDRLGELVRVHDRVPLLAGHVLGVEPGVLEPALVVVRRAAVRVGEEDDLRHRLRERPVARLALEHGLRDLALPQLRLLAPQQLALLPELDEHAHLRAQHVRVERLEDVVDGARRVAAEDLLAVAADRGEEEDRDVARALPLLDQARGLEAVDPRHLHVEQDHGEVPAEQLPERLLAGVRAHELLPERLEDGLEREQVLGAVVDEEDGRGRRRLAHGTHSPRRNFPISRTGRIASAAVALDRGVGHLPRLGRLRVLHDRDPADVPDREQAGGAVRVRAREHDPDRALAVGVGRRLEEDVHRRARVLHPLVGRERERPLLDEQVVVGRGHVHMLRLDRILVACRDHAPARVAPEERLERVALRVRGPVLHEHDRQVDLVGEHVEQLAHRAQPSERGTDDDDLHRLIRPSGRSARSRRAPRSGRRSA